jgi:hypothetical protein
MSREEVSPCYSLRLGMRGSGRGFECSAAFQAVNALRIAWQDPGSGRELNPLFLPRYQPSTPSSHSDVTLQQTIERKRYRNWKYLQSIIHGSNLYR